MKTKIYSLFKPWILALVLLAGSFTPVSAQTFTVVSPNGGENWLTETTQTITWTNTGDSAWLMIEYSLDNSGYWYVLDYAAAPVGTGSYTFQNYLYPTTQAMIRISSLDNPSDSDQSDGYFTITESPVYFTSPYFGSSFYRTSEVLLSWYSYTMTLFDLEYSTDGGNSWTLIDSNVTAYEYYWTTPDLVSDACYIRITDGNNPDVYGLSPVFSITGLPTIALVSPNGGETWSYASYAEVSWTGTNLPYYIYMEYSPDGGTNWQYLGYGYGDPTGGSAQVSVPFDASANALVRVSDASAPTAVFDISDAPFIIDVPPVIVYYPYAGQQLYNRSELYLNWLASDMDLVNIELSTDGGGSWSLVEENIDANLTYYYWVVNGTPSENCQLRISDAADASRFGLSQVFTILETPVITLTSPMGGEIWNTGAPQTISWEYDNPGAYYIYLEYSTDGGQYWNFIGYAVYEGPQGSYQWITPEIESEQYLLRVSDYYLPFVSDTSTVFTIVTFPETPICLVTVDIATNQNVIVWDKPVTDMIDQFVIYKESSQAGVYEAIGTVNYAETAVFTDVNSNPAVKPYRYKLGFADADGNQYPTGDFHQTIHLAINQGVGGSWNLIWSSYLGFDVATYNIFRSFDGVTMEQIASISSSFNSYTDFGAPSGTVYYMIEVVNPNGCNPGGRADDYSVTRSNIATNQYQGIGDNELAAKVSVFPNPASDRINLTLDKKVDGNVVFELTDLLGKVVYSRQVSGVNAGQTEVIATDDLNNGIYLLSIRAEAGSYTGRVVLRN